VRAWGDLLNQKPIAIGGGVLIRLGIESKKAPVNSGILLYCLTEGFQPPNNWGRSDLIGPIAISHSQRDLTGLREEAGNLILTSGFGLEAFQEQPPGLSKCTLLFLHEVYFVGKGKSKVRAVTLEDKPLASGELEATDDAYHPWIPWDQVPATGKQAKPRKFIATNRGSGIALPYVMALRPIVYQGAVKGKKVEREPSERLPRLVPNEPSPGLRVSVSHGIVTIKSDAGINIWGPGYLFLTRWWVNGKPFIADQLPFSERHRTGGIGTSEAPTHSLQVRLQMDLKALGAKKGDKIGLQLLHCDDGWEWVEAGLSFIPKGWQTEVLPELSNRVDFVAE